VKGLTSFLPPTSASCQHQQLVPILARLYLWLEAGWYSSQPPLPLCPSFLLFTLAHGIRRRNILRQHKIQLSEHSTRWKVLDYTIYGTHLLVGFLGDLQLLGGAFPHHNTRPSRWCRNASFEASWCDNSPRKIPYYRLKLIHFGH
jgi:hypothetical protein